MPPTFETVTFTAVEVVVLPAWSRATAVSVCGPFVELVVSHDAEYGADVSSAPMLEPSSLNWTPATALLSAAFAVTETVSETPAPLAGAVSDTVGGVVSVVTVAETAADGAERFPAESSAVTL